MSRARHHPTIATAEATAEFSLPDSIVTKVDISRLVSELERLDDGMTAAAVRGKLQPDADTTPPASQSLTDFLHLNQLTLDDSRARTTLIKRLQQLKDNAPIVHLTFAVPADADSLGQLVQWLRMSVHPQAVIAVGLQPALVAGVYVRTTNQVYDLSLRSMLAGGRDVLTKELEVLRAGS